MRKLFASLFLVGVLLVPGVVLAHGGHHHVMGTVTAVDATHVEVKTTEGKSKSVPIHSDTKFFKGSKGTMAGAASDLKVGTRVMIDLEKDGSAHEIRLPFAKHKM